MKNKKLDRANLTLLEPKIVEYWKQSDVCTNIKQKADDISFVLHSGPTYANEELHIGNLYNLFLKDVAVKWSNICGRSTFLVHGADAHGLPIAQAVTKKTSLTSNTQQFLQACEQHVNTNICSMKEDILRMGILVSDWYSTHSPEYMSQQIGIAYKLWRLGFLVFDFAPVNICKVCKTTLSFSEIEQRDGNHYDCYVLFDGNPYNILIYTTTPFSLYFNQAVSFNTTLEYGLFKLGNHTFISLMSCGKALKAHFLKKVCSEEIQRNTVKNMLGDTVPVIDTDNVKESGSGFVHNSADNSWTDYLQLKKYNIGCRSVFDINTLRFNCNNTWMHEEEVHELVLSLLKKEKRIVSFRESISKVETCWRCSNKLFCASTISCFFDIHKDNLLQRCIEECDKISFLPSSTSLKSTMLKRDNWCISRQRYWGVPIPSLICLSCKHAQFNNNFFKYAIQYMLNHTIESWYFHMTIPDFQCEKCTSTDLCILPMSFDVWFDSALTHSIVLPLAYNRNNSDLLIEGNDQFKGWYQVSLLIHMALYGESNTKAVVTHDFVVDSHKEKLSKSKQNYSSTMSIVEENSAEILRLLFALQEYDSVVMLDDNMIEQSKSEYITWRAAIRFVIQMLEDLERKGAVQNEKISEFDNICISSYCNSLNILLTRYQQDYKIHVVVREWKKYWKRLNKTFFAMCKAITYGDEVTKYMTDSTYSSLLLVLKNTLIFWSAILSFSCEEIWQKLAYFGNDSVLLHRLDNLKGVAYTLEDIEDEISKVDHSMKLKKKIVVRWKEIWRVWEPKKQKTIKKMCMTTTNSQM